MGFRDKFADIFKSGKNEDEYFESQNGESDERMGFEEDSPERGNDYHNPTHDEPKNFKYLDDLIRNGASEIILDSDIVLGDGEELEYGEGIPVECNNILIDGAGHNIDAQHKARIFDLKGTGIAIRNITLKNGQSRNGGAINNHEGSVSLTNVTFIGNIASPERQFSDEKCNGGAVRNLNGKIIILESSFKDNMASNYGGAIHNHDGGMSIINTTFECNSSDAGGAIHNRGTLAMLSSTLEKNTIEGIGGAIYNIHKLTIRDCALNENASACGGAIYNNDEMTIHGSALGQNTAKHGGAIFNAFHTKMMICGCALQKNTAKNGGAVYSNGKMTLHDSTFKQNEARCGGAVYSNEKMLMSDSSLQENFAEETGGAISNQGVAEIKNVAFNNNDSKTECTQDIYNDNDLTLIEPHFTDSIKTIFNLKTISIPREIEHKVHNDGSIGYFSQLEEGQRNFAYLDQLIQNNQKEIKLDHDIKLDLSNMEDEEYSGGISIDAADLVIDGCGHSIDAQGKARIFYVSSENVTLKNITLKNGYSKKEGGAICNRNGTMVIQNVILTDNASNKAGGAIYNWGEITIKDSLISNNSARLHGGAIFSERRSIMLENTEMSNNTSKLDGGAINNLDEMTILESSIQNNLSKRAGGAVFNLGKATISNSRLEDNDAAESGGAITNLKDLTVTQSSIQKNSSQIMGGAIFNRGKAIMKNLKLEKNAAGETGGAIQNTGEAEVHNVSFNDNDAGKCSHDIHNSGVLALDNPHFTNKTETIFNANDMKILENDDDLEAQIYNKGSIIYPLNQSERNFAYLDQLIHGNSKEISLDFDIRLDVMNNEQSDYSGGINIDADGLTIDGCGHTIDAVKKTKIFEVNGKGITIKDISLKRGHANAGGALSNYGELTIQDAVLQENESEVQGGAIYNRGKLTILGATFKGNDSGNHSHDIYNSQTLKLIDAKLSGDMETIKNSGHILLSGSDNLIEEKIFNEGKIVHLDENQKTFTYLNQVIHGNSKEIKLEYDIGLDAFNKENETFAEGIPIDVNDITIDGNGHTINAEGLARIFNVSAKNVILKNFTLENGNMNEDCGGCIQNTGELTILNAAIKGNASKNGGAIGNYATLTIRDSTLQENNAEKEGGAIYNCEGGTVTIESTAIEGNSTDEDYGHGGAIYNCEGGTATIKNTAINGNSTKGEDSSAGAIYNKGNLMISDSSLQENNAEKDGGAIYNCEGGTAAIQGTEIKGNLTNNEHGNGGAIHNSGNISISDSSLQENNAEKDGGAIFNYPDGTVTIKNTAINGNSTNDDYSYGGAVYNMGEAAIYDSFLGNNRSGNRGGAIYNSDKITLEGVSLENNRSDEGGALANMGTMRLQNILFRANSSEYEFSQDIYNRGKTTMLNLIFYDGEKTINNLKNMGVAQEIGQKIYNMGYVFHMDPIGEDERGFSYLNHLIENEEEIRLEHDIKFNPFDIEEDMFIEGVPIETDNLVIDGNGHSIDAQRNARIFNVKGKNITLKNVVLKNGYASDGGGAIINEGEITLQDTILAKNIALTRGGAINNSDDGIMRLEGCRLFENCATKEGCENAKTGVNGGAIYNGGILDIRGSFLKCNHAIAAEFPTVSEGGAIYNGQNGNLDVSDTVFDNNVSMIEGRQFNTYICGGAIINYGAVKMIKCEIKNNRSGINIISNRSQMTIINTDIIGNHLMAADYYSQKLGATISNDANSEDFNELTLENTNLMGNSSPTLLTNRGNAILSISNGKICYNETKVAILNGGKNCIVSKTKFEDNESEGRSPLNMVNGSFMTLKSPEIVDTSYKSIVNDEKIIISNPDLEKIIENNGVIKYGFRDEDRNDFTKLDEIIHSGNGEIVLNQDYSFEEYEIEFFEGGIALDIDGLIIDGQNHVINGNNLSRIFIAMAKDITLKNIIFKNGICFEKYESIRNASGGALRINESGSLTLESCIFENNSSERNGGAITNSGALAIKSGCITQNNAVKGGAINNWGDIQMENANIKGNASTEDGGAVYNHGTIWMKCTSLRENEVHKHYYSPPFFSGKSLLNGGAIFNGLNGKMELIQATLQHNKVYTDEDNLYDCNGGAVSNFGIMEICGSTFRENETKAADVNFQQISKKNTTSGGAIDNHGNITIKSSKFIKNESIKGGAINNKGTIAIRDSALQENAAECRIIVYNHHLMPEMEDLLSFVKPDNAGGGAINNHEEGSILVENVEFGQNRALYGGAIYNDGTLQMTDSKLEENETIYIGGAIYNQSEIPASITNTEFINNDAGGSRIKRPVYGEDVIKSLFEVSAHPMSKLIMLKGYKTLYMKGGGIWAMDENNLELHDCRFTDNNPDDVHYEKYS